MALGSVAWLKLVVLLVRFLPQVQFVVVTLVGPVRWLKLMLLLVSFLP